MSKFSQILAPLGQNPAQDSSIMPESRRHHRQQPPPPPPPPPPILFLRSSPPPYFPTLSTRFHFLPSWSSPLPLPLFVSRHSPSVPAIIVSSSVRLDADILSHLPDLRFVMTTSAGTDHIDLEECRRRGIRVANAGGVYAVDVADYALGLVIDVMLRISAGDRFVRMGMWVGGVEMALASKLGGKRVGIVGLGKIGSEIAKRLEPFGCIIAYNSRTRKPSLSYPYFSNVLHLASSSDILIVCCALNDETHHIINKDVMHALGTDGIMINVGRGALVDENELVQCLVRGEIGGAGLDVFENEPNVPEELLRMDNVVLSAHKAVFTKESIEDSGELIAANLEAFFANEPLLTPVSEQ